MKATYINKEGAAMFIADCPDPKLIWPADFSYRKALAAAKQSAIPFVYQALADKLLGIPEGTIAIIPKDSIHPFPEEWDVEVKKEWRVVTSHYSSEWRNTEPNPFFSKGSIETREVAVFIPVKSEQKDMHLKQNNMKAGIELTTQERRERAENNELIKQEEIQDLLYSIKEAEFSITDYKAQLKALGYGESEQKEESQEELWIAVMDMIADLQTDELEDKFTITRKQ